MTQLTMETVRADIAEVLYVAPGEVRDHDDLVQSGLDSVRIMNLVEQWKQAGAEVSFVELAERPTLAEWWELLAARLPGTTA
ncbi:phosphopantetheine-binding protein [Allokutzneria oryzae]|uniref:Phosphopantetheine-binding protein n=1 Tax=Allokutzneria oryzae TaxID=1378989 RepID=A0ABV5ZPG1_9PSEU